MKQIAFISLLLFAQTSYAETKTLFAMLGKLCAGHAPSGVQARELSDADKIFSIMTPVEKQSCGSRNDDYILFLIKKYQARLSN